MASSDASSDVSLLVPKSPFFHKESLISYKFPTLGACSSHSGMIKCFYVIYDRNNSEDPCSFTCIVLNKATGETTSWTISPAPNSPKHVPLLSKFTPVALGSYISMIGGICHDGLCPNGNPETYFHEHVNVRVFNTLRPENGWKEAAPMHAARAKPAAVVIDGKIYEFGGLSKDLEFGECFDPDTNEWHRVYAPGPGCLSYFANIQDLYVDPVGAKSFIMQSNCTDELFAFHLDTRRWEILGHGFANCHRPGAILDGIVYAVLEDADDYRKGRLHGYDLIQRRWFPVELIELGSEIEVWTYGAFVIATGSDRLCLLWHYSYKRIDKHGLSKRIECLELRLKIYSDTGSGEILNLTATEVLNSYFPVKSFGCLESNLIL